QEPAPLRPTQQLADLEHCQLRKHLTNYDAKGPNYLQGSLTEYWRLTAVPNRANHFREGTKNAADYLRWQESRAPWGERSERGDFMPAAALNNIKPAPALNQIANQRLWLTRDYKTALQQQIGGGDAPPSEQRMTKESRRFGEIT